MKLRKFDTKVQHLKYKVLREVAREEWNGTLKEHMLDIPKKIVPGNEPTMRCCVYKERAILEERIKIAMGGMKKIPMLLRLSKLPAMNVRWAATMLPRHAAAVLPTAARMYAAEARSPLTASKRRISIRQNALSAVSAQRSAPTAQ